MQLLPKKSAFTIIEVIIATTVFAILATAGVALLSEVSTIRQEVKMREYLYTEMQAAIERISKTIQDSAIDYEEYYSWAVEGASDYVENYGDYHAAFFNGSLETGKNPIPSMGYPNSANAICNTGPTCSDNLSLHQVNELYLINGSGTERTFFVVEEGSTSAGDAIAMVKLTGTDTNNNGLIDVSEWTCATAYNCSTGIPTTTDLTDTRDNDNFVPITPSNINIDSLYFYISPIEDPYKAFAEDDLTVFESVQVQPKVTIVVTASYVTEGIDGPTITLQTTIGTGVYHKISTAK